MTSSIASSVTPPSLFLGLSLHLRAAWYCPTNHLCSLFLPSLFPLRVELGSVSVSLQPLLIFSSSASCLSVITFCVFFKPGSSIGTFFYIFHSFPHLLMIPSNFLDVWSVFSTAVFSLLSSNSIICTISGSFDWLFFWLWITFSCLFACLVDFFFFIGCQTSWFYAVRCWVLLLIPLISVRLCLGMQWRRLESAEFFGGWHLCLDWAGPEQPGIQLTPCDVMLRGPRDALLQLVGTWVIPSHLWVLKCAWPPISGGSSPASGNFFSYLGRLVLTKDSRTL